MLALIAVCFWPLTHWWVPSPSPTLLQGTAQIAAAFLVAYAVEASWLLKVSKLRSPNRANWVGITCGVGGAGLGGVAVGLLLAERARLGHWGLADELLFAVLIAAFTMLGLFVSLSPLLVYEWTRPTMDDD